MNVYPEMQKEDDLKKKQPSVLLILWTKNNFCIAFIRRNMEVYIRLMVLFSA